MKKLFILLLLLSPIVRADIIATPPAGTPVPMTLEQKQVQQKASIKAVINVQYNVLTSSITKLFGMVWSNPAGLTPQQVFDAFGTDCAQLHGLFALFSNALNTAKAGSITLAEPHPVTVNGDGSCTVGQ